jgi:rubrerythrin
MEAKTIKEFLLQALEHERGGVQIYETAVQCAQNEELKEEWTKYLEETEVHVQLLQDACLQLHLDPEEQTPMRKIVRDMGASLVAAMKTAQGAGDKAKAEIVAAECVTLAEMKCQSNWELIGQCAEKMEPAEGNVLKAAYAEASEQENEHFFHSKGWMRELTLQSLGLKAMIPPPEERKDVKTPVGAARVEASRLK